MVNKLLLQLELQAISAVEDITNLHTADLIRHTRLLVANPNRQEVELYYSLVKKYQNGILTYIEPLNKALANCVGCGTDANQAYISYCEKLAKNFRIIHGVNYANCSISLDVD